MRVFPANLKLPSRGAAALALTLLAGAIALARLHTYHEPMEIDATTYSVIANELLHGRELYSDVWDLKPPAIFITYAAAQCVAGYGYGAIYLLNVWAAIATLLGVYAAASVAGRWAGLLAALFWTLLSGDLVTEANQPNTEAFINALSVWSLAILVRRPPPLGWKRAAAVGLLLGWASLYKQVALTYAAAACVAIVAPATGARKRALAEAGALLGVVAALWACTLFYFWGLGRWNDFHAAVFVFAREYAGDLWWNVLSTLSPLRSLPPTKWIALVSVCLGAGGAIATIRRDQQWRVPLVLASYVVATHLAVALPGQFFPHYYQLWLPLSAVTGAVGLAWISRLPGRLWRLAALAGAVAAVAVLVWHEGRNYALDPEEWAMRKGAGEQLILSREMGHRAAALLEPNETLWSWGSRTAVYFDSGRRPASGVVFLAPFRSRTLRPPLMRRLLADLEAHPPELFLVDAAGYLQSDEDSQALRWRSANYRRWRDEMQIGFWLYVRRGGALETRLIAAGRLAPEPGGS